MKKKVTLPISTRPSIKRRTAHRDPDYLSAEEEPEMCAMCEGMGCADCNLDGFMKNNGLSRELDEFE